MQPEFISDDKINNLKGTMEGNILILEGMKYKIVSGNSKGLVVIKL